MSIECYNIHKLMLLTESLARLETNEYVIR